MSEPLTRTLGVTLNQTFLKGAIVEAISEARLPMPVMLLPVGDRFA